MADDAKLNADYVPHPPPPSPPGPPEHRHQDGSPCWWVGDAWRRVDERGWDQGACPGLNTEYAPFGFNAMDNPIRTRECAEQVETDPLLVESPMDRYECCEHCRTRRCPRHDGHPDPCSADPLVAPNGCRAGSTMLGEPVNRPAGACSCPPDECHDAGADGCRFGAAIPSNRPGQPTGGGTDG